jgi:hypothetical protein
MTSRRVFFLPLLRVIVVQVVKRRRSFSVHGTSMPTQAARPYLERPTRAIAI